MKEEAFSYLPLWNWGYMDGRWLQSNMKGIGPRIRCYPITTPMEDMMYHRITKAIGNPLRRDITLVSF